MTTCWPSAMPSDGDRARLTIVDTSVAVPAVLSGHSAHQAARSFVDQHAPWIAAHALFESFSVLTRLPGMKLDAADALRLLESSFPAVAELDHSGTWLNVRTFAAGAIAGGAVYDGLVGLAARAADGLLVTMDARATTTYERLGVKFRVLSPGDTV